MTQLAAQPAGTAESLDLETCFARGRHRPRLATYRVTELLGVMPDVRRGDWLVVDTAAKPYSGEYAACFEPAGRLRVVRWEKAMTGQVRPTGVVCGLVRVI